MGLVLKNELYSSTSIYVEQFSYTLTGISSLRIATELCSMLACQPCWQCKLLLQEKIHGCNIWQEFCSSYSSKNSMSLGALSEKLFLECIASQLTHHPMFQLCKCCMYILDNILHFACKHSSHEHALRDTIACV